ncbi:5'/3'-nucleotidase SurE [Patescibacteria group bacterium]|nr:5'/3'-nucleotidase SurE [Patescibacteria group bacterium]MBU2035904.1 5'/3'-nucleotidase SurE [Patescibacteria group bacterium]
MKLKRILITGDDGYNSVGTRTLAHLLKKKYEVNIAATLRQQSGTGGKISLTNNIPWGEEKVEGVSALWVDGSPADAIEVAQGYFKKPFDFVISGINYGENVGYSLVSSGTFSAAVRAIGVQLAPKAIVLSWQTTANNFFIKHKVKDDLSSFLKYPGEMAIKLIEKCINNNCYGKELVNINFPNTPTDKVRIVKPARDITRLWKYPLDIDKKRKFAHQPKETYSRNLETEVETDVGALHKGHITITPLNYLS